MTVELPQWIHELRRSEIVKRVKDDDRTVGETLLGVSSEVAFRDVIGGGQANFDEPWHDLAPGDRVLLYAYLNQPGHLEELTEAFRMLFEGAARPTDPIVVDVGCGPFTGGLALSTALDHDSHLDYIGVDCSVAMRELGERLASAAAELGQTPQIDRQWSSDLYSVHWNRAPGFRPVFVIVSYLLASPTLDAEQLVIELDALLSRLGRGAVTLLYTNSERQDANRNYPEFRLALQNAGFEQIADDSGSIEIGRWSGTRHRPLRYALFRRPEQSTLQL